jgi:flagellar biosynthesis protein FlhG
MLETAHDQATGLRRMFEQAGPTMFSIVGAPGTTAVTMELARALAQAGRRVLILDRSAGEAAAALGLRARYELADVIGGTQRLADVIADAGTRVSVLPSAQALQAIDDGDMAMRDSLARLLEAARDRFDLCLVNGLAPAADSARDVLLVTAPTRVSITEAYGRIKSLAPHRTRYRLRVVNHARNEDAARSIYASLAQTARRFLAAQLDFCAYLPPAETTLRSARAQALTRLASGLVAESASHYALQ